MGKFVVLMLITILPISVFSIERRYSRIESFLKRQPPWDFTLMSYHHQSPINVRRNLAQQIFGVKNFLIFDRKYSTTVPYIMTNSGHGVEIVLDPHVIKENPHLIPTLSGGILPDVYLFKNIHYHWGINDIYGSEHLIDDVGYSLEGHIVMYKKSYGTFEVANNHHDGIIVFTFFGEVGPENVEMNNFLNNVHFVMQKSKQLTVHGTDYALWALPQVASVNTDYLAYPGSLTTHPFTESVTFFLFPNAIWISHRQMEILRHIKDEHNKYVSSNHRKIHPLLERPIAIVKDNFLIDQEAKLVGISIND